MPGLTAGPSCTPGPTATSFRPCRRTRRPNASRSRPTATRSSPISATRSVTSAANTPAAPSRCPIRSISSSSPAASPACIPRSSRVYGAAGSARPFAFLDRALHFRRQHFQVFGESCEQLTLGHVGRELADQRALLGVVEEFFQMHLHVLHGAGPRAVTEHLSLWTATRSIIQL